MSTRPIAWLVAALAAASSALAQIPENLPHYWVAVGDETKPYYEANSKWFRGEKHSVALPMAPAAPFGPVRLAPNGRASFRALLAGGVRDYMLNNGGNLKSVYVGDPNGAGFAVTCEQLWYDWWASDAARPGPLPTPEEPPWTVLSDDGKQQTTYMTMATGSTFSWTAPAEPGIYWVTIQIKARANVQTRDADHKLTGDIEFIDVGPITRRIKILVGDVDDDDQAPPEDAAVDAGTEAKPDDTSTVYSHAVHRYSLKLPQGWEESEDGGSYQVFAREDAEDALILVNVTKALARLTPDEAKALVGELILDGLFLDSMAPATDIRALPDGVGVAVETTGKDEDGQYRVYLHVISTDTDVYVIAGVGGQERPQDSWEETKQIVESFRPAAR